MAPGSKPGSAYARSGSHSLALSLWPGVPLSTAQIHILSCHATILLPMGGENKPRLGSLVPGWHVGSLLVTNLTATLYLTHSVSSLLTLLTEISSKRGASSLSQGGSVGGGGGQEHYVCLSQGNLHLFICFSHLLSAPNPTAVAQVRELWRKGERETGISSHPPNPSKGTRPNCFMALQKEP